MMLPQSVYSDAETALNLKMPSRVAVSSKDLQTPGVQNFHEQPTTSDALLSQARHSGGIPVSNLSVPNKLLLSPVQTIFEQSDRPTEPRALDFDQWCQDCEDDDSCWDDVDDLPNTDRGSLSSNEP